MLRKFQNPFRVICAFALLGLFISSSTNSSAYYGVGFNCYQLNATNHTYSMVLSSSPQNIAPFYEIRNAWNDNLVDTGYMMEVTKVVYNLPVNVPLKARIGESGNWSVWSITNTCYHSIPWPITYTCTGGYPANLNMSWSPGYYQQSTRLFNHNTATTYAMHTNNQDGVDPVDIYVVQRNIQYDFQMTTFLGAIYKETVYCPLN